MKHLSLRACMLAFFSFGASAHQKTGPGIIEGRTYYVPKNRVSNISQISQPSQTCPACPAPLPNLPLDGSTPLPNPTPLPGAFFPNPAAANQLVTPPQTLGVSFIAGKQGADPEFVGSPPDTYGVIGLTQFVMADNQGNVSFDRTGKRDTILDTEDSTLTNLDGNFSLFIANHDARIHYDRLADRFVIINLAADTTVGTVGYTGFTLAVSDSGTLTKNTQWTVFTVFDNATIPDSNSCPGDVTNPVTAGCVFDYPCLGIDANALYISFSVFPNTTGAWTTNSLYVIQKKSFYHDEGPVVITAFPEVTKTISGDFIGDQGSFRANSTLFPLNNFDDPRPKFGYALCQDPAFFGKLRLYRILNAGTRCPSITGPFIVDVMQTFVKQSDPNSFSPFLGQLYGDLGLIEGLDDRLADSSHINKKQIYTAHSIQMNNQGISDSTGDRRGIRWYQLDVTGDPTGQGLGKETATTVPALVQAGSLFDTVVSNPLYYTFPAIMSNKQGDISISGSVMGVNQPPSAFFVGKAGTDPKDGTLKIGAVQPNTYVVGSGTFTRNLGNGGFGFGQRWGDMSYCSLDPVDRKTIWTIQEIIQQGVQTQVVAQLIAP